MKPTDLRNEVLVERQNLPINLPNEGSAQQYDFKIQDIDSSIILCVRASYSNTFADLFQNCLDEFHKEFVFFDVFGTKIPMSQSFEYVLESTIVIFKIPT